jgi:hypothetical protein
VAVKRPKRRRSDPANRLRRSRRSKSQPKTGAAHQAKPEKARETYARVLNVISKMRSDKLSLHKASREIGISPRTVKRWVTSVLQKSSAGKWVAKNSDRFLRVLMIPTSDGTREIAVRGSRQATLLAEYWNAVHKYLETGDTSKLLKFQGKFIKDASGAKISLVTDPKELNRLGFAGVLSFESLYARSA